MTTNPLLEDYRKFCAIFPHKKAAFIANNFEVSIDYFETTFKSAEKSGEMPILFLANSNASASSFFKQIQFFETQKMHAIAISLPALFDPISVIRAIDVFVDSVILISAKFHLVGSGLGGYLAQLYCQNRPSRISSLFLINSFTEFRAGKSFSGLFSSLFSSSLVLEASIPSELSFSGIQASDFVRLQMSEFSLFEIGAKIEIEKQCSEISPLLPILMLKNFEKDNRITILESFDEIRLTETQKSQLGKFYVRYLILSTFLG